MTRGLLFFGDGYRRGQVEHRNFIKVQIMASSNLRQQPLALCVAVAGHC